MMTETNPCGQHQVTARGKAYDIDLYRVLDLDTGTMLGYRANVSHSGNGIDQYDGASVDAAIQQAVQDIRENPEGIYA